jgi:leader peptidase (prepilin peptidase)/N-methyltransferase
VGFHPVLPAYLYLAAISVALALIDLAVKRLPDKIVLPSYIVAITLLGIAAVAGHDYHSFLRALEGMAAYYAAFYALAFIYPAGMGFGDVKLAGVLGLYLGWIGWGVLAVGAFGGIFIGAVVGVTLMAAGRAGRKSAIPFGPFMLAGAMFAVFTGAALFHAYLRTTGSA